MAQLTEFAEGKVVAVRENLVLVEVTRGDIMKNEVVYVVAGDERLKSEVLRIRGRLAEIQVFEDTSGLRVGDRVEFEGSMLSAVLGPGLLGKVFDGLQNPLARLASEHGFFLPRGRYLDALDTTHRWAFTPEARMGTSLRAGDTLGTVQEGRFPHRIMIPFDEAGPVQVTWIQAGNFTIEEPVARYQRSDGVERTVTMAQRWPVRKPLPEQMIRARLTSRLLPTEPLATTIRLIDTFFPIARGGMACIPGPFGAGKTVLQGLIARYSDVDVVIVVACGERAGEVVELITDFPAMKDPKTGGSLMDRTIIICNTSSMPVAAREASIYTGMTLGEYYRQMGYNVLLLADSTSRWAQALRELSGRMEEIPGEEAYPAYLDSSIKALYERAGVIRTRSGAQGSLTMIGTVSPAGGNFEEPVTQSTLATVKAFLGLSYDRAYKRQYPAVDPLISWSRYFEQLAPWYASNMGPAWTREVETMMDVLHRGDAVSKMMQVTGEEGVTIDDFVLFQKANLLDLAFLQQDAFDPVDVSTPLERQRAAFELLQDLLRRDYVFETKDQARDVFIRLVGLLRNLNYSAWGSPDYDRYRAEVVKLADAHQGWQPASDAPAAAPDSATDA
ncbi:MAG: V-type ATP synthase subunit A [Myxococcales bacterium]|nr:V-type ATP synthase subunit A [Myxococcales bacterium]